MLVYSYNLSNGLGVSRADSRQTRAAREIFTYPNAKPFRTSFAVQPLEPLIFSFQAFYSFEIVMIFLVYRHCAFEVFEDLQQAEI